MLMFQRLSISSIYFKCSNLRIDLTSNHTSYSLIIECYCYGKVIMFSFSINIQGPPFSAKDIDHYENDKALY